MFPSLRSSSDYLCVKNEDGLSVKNIYDFLKLLTILAF